MSENQVSLQIATYLCDDNVFTHVHVYACALNYMYGKWLVKVYSQALNVFMLARFHLEFGNSFMVNNRWHKAAF